jgi:cobalt-zinc-cadmium efflux system protein
MTIIKQGNASESKDNEKDHDHVNPFLIPFILISIFAIIEFVGGVLTHSLALIGDSWHMLTDTSALGLAMYAAYRTNKAQANNKKSQSELFASIINAVIMLVVIIWIIIEAIERLKNPRPVMGGYVMLVALAGLVVNVVVALRLNHHANHHGGGESLNQRAAMLHVIGDLLGSIAALVAGAVIYFTAWLAIDPILSILISLLLLVVTINLIKDIWRTFKGQSVDRSHHGHHH